MTSSTFRRSSSSAPTLRVAFSTRHDGDFHPRHVDASMLRRRQSAIVDRRWTLLDQCHGTTIVEIDRPGQHDGAKADAAMSGATDVALGVWAADCAPIVLIGAHRWFATIHAGWRGLAGGIIGAVVDALPEPLVGAVIGPTIGPCCYEFGSADADRVAAGTGCRRAELVRDRSDGVLRLDMIAAIRSALGAYRIEPSLMGACTGCDPDQFSHRVRSEPERHVLVAWQEPASGAPS